MSLFYHIGKMKTTIFLLLVLLAEFLVFGYAREWERLGAWCRCRCRWHVSVLSIGMEVFPWQRVRQAGAGSVRVPADLRGALKQKANSASNTR